MPRERNNIKAGIFMLLSIGLIVGIILMISGTSRLTDTWVKRKVSFTLTDDVGGLRVGDDVRIGGYTVGEVRSIDIVGIDGAQGQPRIIVTFKLPNKYVLRDGARIGIQGTLVGQSWLNIDQMGTGEALTPATFMVGRPSQLGALTATLAEIAPELKGVITDVRTQTIPKVNSAIDKTADTVTSFKTTAETGTGLLAHVNTKIDPAIDKYNTITTTGTEMMAKVRDLIGDTTTDFRGTVKNLNETTGTIKEKLPAILDKASGLVTKIDERIGETKAILENIQATSANLKDITESGKSVLVSNRGKIDAMIASLKITGDNLKAATAEIRRSPWRLLYKPAPSEMANLNLYDSARQFAEGANDLNDAAIALRDTLKDPKADPDRVKKLVEKLDQTFTGFEKVEDALWKNVRD